MRDIRVDTSKACVIGWDGDKDGIIAYMEGGYFIRDGRFITVDFGIVEGVKKLSWYNSKGYLPCLITSFEKSGCEIAIQNFADKVIIQGNAFVIVYSRVEIKNPTDRDIVLSPDVRGEVTILHDPGELIKAHSTSRFDYAVVGDRFGNAYSLPTEQELIDAGDYDTHYASMEKYWEEKLASIVNIKELPDSRLIEAYKAGYIYTHIIKDGYDLHVGENGYDEVFDHDAIGILIALFVLGDYADAKRYLDNLQAQIQYDDAKWKLAWPFALYLLKTGDLAYIEEKFDIIKEYARNIEADLTGPKGIVKETWDIDNIGYWTVDNWSVLMGLSAYIYIARALHEEEEVNWANRLYDALLQSATEVMTDTMAKHHLNYIPASMVESNDANVCRNPRNTNWASMFLFGRWAWDGYLFGAKQYGVMIDKIDATYDYGLQRGLESGLFPHSFGGGTFSNSIGSYNSGLAATGLRGERYRSEGIYAYQAMISYGMTGPYAWWESSGEPQANTWSGLHPVSGDGSCPHMWGQAMASKVLIESLIAEKADRSIIIGRGIPEEWLFSGKRIHIENYPIADNKRMGYVLQAEDKKLRLEWNGDMPEGNICIQIKALANRIDHISQGEFDEETGEITLAREVRILEIILKEEIRGNNLAFCKGVTAKIIPSKYGTFANCTNGSLEHYTQAMHDKEWDCFVDLGRPTDINRVNLYTDRLAYAKKFEIQVSVDKERWKTVAWEDHNDGLGKSYLFGTQRARFVKIKVDKIVSQNNEAHAIRLIEIYGD